MYRLRAHGKTTPGQSPVKAVDVNTMISSRIKPSRFAIPLGGAISIVAVALLCGGCERHVQVTKEMTWECLPEERDSRYPDAEPVMFRSWKIPSISMLPRGSACVNNFGLRGRPRPRSPMRFGAALFKNYTATGLRRSTDNRCVTSAVQLGRDTTA